MKRVVLLVTLSLIMAAPSFSQSKTPVPFIQSQWFKSNGTVAAGYKLCTYAAGTTTPATTYTTANAGGPNTNPVTLDSAGRADVFLSASSYKFVLYAPGTGNTCNGQSVGTLIWTEDNIAGYSIASVFSSPLAIASGGTGNTTGVRNAIPFGATGNPVCSAPGSDSYLNSGGAALQTGLSAAIHAVQPIPGTINKLYVILGDVVPASQSAVFTVYRDLAGTTLTCTIAAGANSCSDTSHSFTVVAGNFLDIKLTCAGGVAALTGSTSATVLITQ